MKKEISTLILAYIFFITALIAVCCFVACNTPIVPIKMDRPLKPDSTVIIVPQQMNTTIGQFLEHGIQDVYRLPYNYSSFPVLREKTEFGTCALPISSNKVFISVGNTSFNIDSNYVKSLPPCSFVINKKGRFIRINGSDDAGTYAGVEYFLNNYCGVTHYMPGKLFTTVPTDSTISLPENIYVINSPFTRCLTSSGWVGTGDTINKNNIYQWDSYWALLNSLQYTDWGQFQHTMSSYFFDSDIIRDFPKAYPIINGKISLPTSYGDPNFEPDFFSPDIVPASYTIAMKYFDYYKNWSTIAFSVMDSKNGYITTGQSLIDANAKWLNDLADTLPFCKTVAFTLYSNVNGEPSFKWSKNVLPITVWHLSNFDAAYSPYLDDLHKSFIRIGNDDWGEGKGFIYPRIYTGLISKYLKSLKKQGISFDFAHIETYPNWALDGFKYWEMSKIYRNPDIDVDSLRLKECKDLFGDAALQMKAYFDALEQISYWLNNHSDVLTH